MPTNPEKRPLSEERIVRAELESSRWWWKRPLHEVFVNGLADDPKKALARLKATPGFGLARAKREVAELFGPEWTILLFESQFEESAWRHEADRRFNNSGLPAYPELTHKNRLDLAEKWPGKWRQSDIHIHPLNLVPGATVALPKADGSPSKTVMRSHGTEPLPNFTRYLCVSYNLNLRTNELLDSLKRFILAERDHFDVPEPGSPGAPMKNRWKRLEDHDVSQRVHGYLASDDSARSVLSVARKRSRSA